MLREAEFLRQAGRRPYIIPEGASNPLGAWGYIRAAEELVADIAGLPGDSKRPVTILHATGSGGTAQFREGNEGAAAAINIIENEGVSSRLGQTRAVVSAVHTVGHDLDPATGEAGLPDVMQQPLPARILSAGCLRRRDHSARSVELEYLEVSQHLAHHRDAMLTDPYDDPESNYLDPAVWAGEPLASLKSFHAKR